jgi:hypothetical protein
MRTIFQEKDKQSANQRKRRRAQDDSLPTPLSSQKSHAPRNGRTQREHTNQICERSASTARRPAYNQLHADGVDARQADTHKKPENCGAQQAIRKECKTALNIAPKNALNTKILLAGNRSANPLSAKVDVPRMKPSWTAFVRSPIPEMPMPHARIRSGAALFALNQSDVPNSCAIAIVATGCDRTSDIEVGELNWSLMPRECSRGSAG